MYTRDFRVYLPILVEFGVGDLRLMPLCGNRFSEKYTFLRGLNEILPIFSVFFFRIGYSSVPKMPTKSSTYVQLVVFEKLQLSKKFFSTFHWIQRFIAVFTKLAFRPSFTPCPIYVTIF
jgi:hypothetical protein